MTTQFALPTITDTNLLCEAWLETKTQLNETQAKLDELARQLSEQLQRKVEGSETHKVGIYTVTLTGRINRKLDQLVLAELSKDIDPSFLPLKSSFDESKWKKLLKDHPTIAAQMSEAVTEAVGKTGVEVKV